VEAAPHPDEALLAIHDRELLDYLASAWDGWSNAGLPEDPGQPQVVPYIFAHRGLGPVLAVPKAPWATAGYFAFDTMTPVGPGTWEAARARSRAEVRSCAGGATALASSVTARRLTGTRRWAFALPPRVAARELAARGASPRARA
jgi:acetoin utilization deacetylase AcuC-like enzyme